MSEPNTTATVPVPNNDGCHFSSRDSLRDLESITAEYRPEATISYGSQGQYTMDRPATVVLRIGERMELVLSRAVWRAVFEAVEAVTPAEVPA